MSSKLAVVSEKEVPSPESPTTPGMAAEPARTATGEIETERKSAQSSETFLHTVSVLQEIRRVLNARAEAMLGMLGALGLTAFAMNSPDWMKLGIAVSFDILVFIPMAAIAYLKKS